jgi:hypothetical protein
LYEPAEQFDREVELSAGCCSRDTSIAEAWLDAAAAGTCVLTYHGFGGRIPSTYRLVRSVPIGSDHLRLWTKGRPGRARGFFLEIDDPTMSNGGLQVFADGFNARAKRPSRSRTSAPKS